MKTTLITSLCTMLFLFIVTSCNQEDLFVEAIEIVDEQTDETTEEDTIEEDTTEEDSQADVSLPCDFTLENVDPNTTIIINCILDLQGATVNLPANVTIEYEGGDIINGTINFMEGSIIAGELLNSSLIIGGTNPQIKDPVFEFIPSRWGIVEGWTTSDIAQTNNNILDGIMLTVRDMGVTTFKINKMDAYFETSFVTSTTTNQNYYHSEAVNVPSNFELIMTDETILRQFPVVGKKVPSLLVVVDAENVTIRGGVLYGDRDIKTYNKENEEYGSHLITIRSGRNVVVDGVKFTMSSVSALTMNSIGFTFNSDYKPTNNVLIKNCIFDKNRSMALVITDGYNIIIDNNQFIDTAQPTANSDAGTVRWAMNIEPIRKRDEATGEIVEYQKVHDVIVRNNTERGSNHGGFNVFTGQHITFDNNDMESQINFSFGNNIKVLNNTFNASEKTKTKPGISGGSKGDTVFNNLISGNTINGYSVGVNANFQDAKIVNNTINNCYTGFQFRNPEGLEIYGNKITSTVAGSRGFWAHLASLNNVNIYNNEIAVAGHGISFNFINQNLGEENNTVNITNNISSNSGSIVGFNTTKGFIKCVGNSINGSVYVSHTYNVDVIGNQINTPNNHGMLLNGTNINNNIQDNVINYPTTGGFQCIKIATTIDLNELTLTNNSCN